MNELYIRGIEVAYYFICKRKLWLFSNDITTEHNSELVDLGKILHENAYSRKRKEIEFEGIKIDFFEKNKGVIYEIKKSRALEEAHFWQIKYYLYRLKQLGIYCKGMINYPLIREKVEITLTEDDEIAFSGILREIENIKMLEKPPNAIESKICKKCSYYELCYA